MKKYLLPLALISLSACSSGSATPPVIAQPGVAAVQCDNVDPSVRDFGRDLDNTGYRYNDPAPHDAPQAHDGDQSPGHQPDQNHPDQNQDERLSKDPGGEQLSDLVIKATKAICTGDTVQEAELLPKIEAIEDFFQAEPSNPFEQRLEQIETALSDNLANS